MISWVAYVLIVSSLVGIAAAVMERSATGLGLPVRWIWAFAFVVALTVVVLPGTGADVGSWVGDRAVGGVSLGVPSVVEAAWAARDPGGAMQLRREVWVDRALGFAWGLVSAFLLIRWIGASRRARRWIGRWEPLVPRMEVGGRPVLVAPHAGPAVLGILQNQVVVPRWCSQLSTHEKNLILAHEAEHVRARDSLLLAAGYLMTILMPWNVAFWMYFRRLQTAVELDCDARVVDTAPGIRRTYGRLLLTAAARSRDLGPVPTMFSFRSSSLARRILMLSHDRRGALRIHHLLLLAGGLLLAVGSCLVPGPDRNGESPTAPDEVASPPAAAEVEASQPDRTLAVEPTFTPFTVAPEIRNRAEVQRELQREYPSTLRDEGIGGTVLMHFFIDEEGRLRNTVVAESSGHAVLDEAAERVANAFEFWPAMNRDEHVPVWIQIPITFRPPGDGTERVRAREP